MDRAALEDRTNPLSSVVPCLSLLLCSQYILSPLKAPSYPLGPIENPTSPEKSFQMTPGHCAPFGFCILILVSRQLGPLKHLSSYVFSNYFPFFFFIIIYCFIHMEQLPSWTARFSGVRYILSSLCH